jgi:hypothetical protein
MVNKKQRLVFVLLIVGFVCLTAFVVYKLQSKKIDYQPLLGQWLRPDGGYVIDIKSIDQNGKMETAYLNPKPINVSKAQASINNDKIELLIELRDQFYPGNYYTLTFDPESKQLIGVYHHLGLNQNFDIYFIKQ